MTDIFTRYPEFRDKPREMAMLCTLLRERGLHEDAFAIGEAAIAAAPDSLAIGSEIRATLSRRIEAFHGPMMLDRARNAAYAAAIEQAVRPGMLVLEIGAGSGLLAMIAARAGADVVTCEENPLIAIAAQRIVERNGWAHRIKVVAKRSDAVQIPEDMPRAADMVIHEIFGSRIFDEGVTGALTDARQRLLKPGAPSVPQSAHIRCALVASAKGAPETLGNVHGFDLSPFELLVRPARSVWSSVRRGLELRSAPGSALPMDYDSPPPFGAASDSVVLQSTGGRIDGIVQWLNIGFSDATTLENDPFEDDADSSWAALYQGFPTPVDTKAGDLIDVKMSHRGRQMTLDASKRDSA